MKTIICMTTLILSITSCSEKQAGNPLLEHFTTPHQTPPFDRIETRHYEPAFDQAIEEAKQSDTWKEFTHNAAYDERPIPAPGEETVEFCHNEYKDLHDYMVEQGTLVKDYDDLK